MRSYSGSECPHSSVSFDCSLMKYKKITRFHPSGNKTRYKYLKKQGPKLRNDFESLNIPKWHNMPPWSIYHWCYKLVVHILIDLRGIYRPLADKRALTTSKMVFSDVIWMTSKALEVKRMCISKVSCAKTNVFTDILTPSLIFPRLSNFEKYKKVNFEKSGFQWRHLKITPKAPSTQMDVN